MCRAKPQSTTRAASKWARSCSGSVPRNIEDLRAHDTHSAVGSTLLYTATRQVLSVVCTNFANLTAVRDRENAEQSLPDTSRCRRDACRFCREHCIARTLSSRRFSGPTWGNELRIKQTGLHHISLVAARTSSTPPAQTPIPPVTGRRDPLGTQSCYQHGRNIGQS